MYDIQFDIAALILYMVIIFLYFQKPHVKDRMHTIYISLFTCATLTPVFDIISSLALAYKWRGYWVFSATTLYYLSLQGITYFFLRYIIYQLDQYRKISILRLHAIKLPLIFEVLLIATNDFTGWIFHYSREEGYYTGPMQWTCYAVAIFYFMWTLFYITRYKKVYDAHLVRTVYGISIINLISITMQSILPTVLLISFGFAVSMVLLFVTAHTKNSAIDTESGMLNREYFNETATKLIFTKKPFTLVLARIADYDILKGIYGLKNTDVLMQQIATRLGPYVNVGSAFKINNSCFAFFIYNPNEVDEFKLKLRDSLDEEWSVDDEKMAFSYLITSIPYPAKIRNMDEFSAYVTYFEKMKRARYGLVPNGELKIRDKVREQKVEQAIRRGIEDNNLSVYYQPICTAKDAHFVSSEALVRLNDPELGNISPAEFIPIAEQSGLMVPIGNFVLEEVCRFISTHNMKKLGIEYIEVNLSVIQCLQRNFISNLDSIISKYKINKKYLCFEITETAANCSPEIFTANLEALANRGYLLALDDFGSGYGNLQRMITSHFSIIKFDKEMTERICQDENLKAFFIKTLPVFKSLDHRIVSEGVETKEQYEFLRDAGTDYIQGYYFSRPVPEDQYVDFLKEHLAASKNQ